MSFDTYQAFQATLPSVEWVDVENDLCNLRAIKTPAELEVIRMPIRLPRAVFRLPFRPFEPGVSERAVAAAVEAAMRASGR